MQLLKQRKTYENQRNSLMQQSFNIEQASFATQTMQDTALTLQAMKGANLAMKNQMKEFNLDDLEVLFNFSEIDSFLLFHLTLLRIFKMNCRTCLIKRMKFKKLCLELMICLAILMKPIWNKV